MPHPTSFLVYENIKLHSVYKPKPNRMFLNISKVNISDLCDVKSQFMFISSLMTRQKSSDQVMVLIFTSTTVFPCWQDSSSFLPVFLTYRFYAPRYQKFCLDKTMFFTTYKRNFVWLREELYSSVNEMKQFQTLLSCDTPISCFLRQDGQVLMFDMPLKYN